MGSGASADINTKVGGASDAEIQECLSGLTKEQVARLSEAVGGGASAAGPPPNAAFVFIKPHANTEKVKELAKSGLEAKGIKILQEGELKGAVIDEKKLIDQHYYAIAVKATIKTPAELNVPNDKFKEQFGVDFKEVLDGGKCFNALDGCKEFGCDADGMAEAWNKAKDDKKLVKLGGGFYCGLLKVGEKELYIMNGFFMSMRSKFTNPSAAIYYYNVQWDPKDLAWADFRGKVLGPTNPAEAPADSLRGQIFANWKDLGLAGEPNTGDNGMHASASPFEGLAERSNWLEAKIGDDPFGKALVAGGMKEEMIKDWSVDPQVNVEAEKDSKDPSKVSYVKGSIFDALEDLDSNECLTRLCALSKFN
jgi:hypothetical protein